MAIDQLTPKKYRVLQDNLLENKILQNPNTVEDEKYPASVTYGRSTFWLNSDIQNLLRRITEK